MAPKAKAERKRGRPMSTDGTDLVPGRLRAALAESVIGLFKTEAGRVGDPAMGQLVQHRAGYMAPLAIGRRRTWRTHSAIRRTRWKMPRGF